MNAAVTGLTEAVRTMGQPVSKPRPEDMRVGKPEPYAPGKDFDDWDFTFNGYAGTLDPAYPAEDSETIANIGDGDSTTRTAVCNIAVSPHDAHTERSTESGEESWKQRFRSLQTTVPDVRNVRSVRQHGTVRANQDVQVEKIEDVEDRLNEFRELVRRYDEANGTDPVPDQVKKACIISNTLEPLKTHLQLNVGKLGNFSTHYAWRLKST